MAGSHFIDGDPYSAQVFVESDGSKGISFLQAVIEPPVTLNPESTAIDCVLDTSSSTRVRAQNVITTKTKSLIELTIESDNKDEEDEECEHDRRVEIGLESAHQLIGLLNRIENGTFDGLNYLVNG